MAADDVMGKIAFQAPDEGTGTDAVLVAAAIQARSEGDFSSSANATSLDFMTGASEAATTKMSVMSSGKVGIGIVAPVTTLHLFGGGTSNPATTGTDPAAGTVLRLRPGNNAILDIGGNGTSGAWLQSYDQTGMQTEYPLLLNPNGGDVGIGTTAPECELHVFKASSGADTDGSAVVHIENSGTTVLQLSAGTSSDCHIAFGDSGNQNIGSIAYLNNGNHMAFRTDNGEKMRLTGAGNLGIGLTAPAYPLDVFGVIAIKSGESLSWKGDAQLSAAITGEGASPVLKFWTSVNERMRIDAGGIVSIGGTNATAKLNVVGQGGSNVQLQNNIVTGTGGMVQIGFLNDNGLVGSIQTSGTGTSYVTSSDYRLKENIEYTWNATSRLKKLKPARFNFITDAEKTFDGFLAHEAQAVVPEAVTGTKDEVDDDGNPVIQGIDQAKLVPLLVKTVQEQQTVIESLEARITALE